MCQKSRRWLLVRIVDSVDQMIKPLKDYIKSSVEYSDQKKNPDNAWINEKNELENSIIDISSDKQVKSHLINLRRR